MFNALGRYIFFFSLDPSYLKAYYRRGSANFALSKYKEALKDFKHVIKVQPTDKDARAKYRVRKTRELLSPPFISMALNLEPSKTA